MTKKPCADPGCGRPRTHSSYCRYHNNLRRTKNYIIANSGIEAWEQRRKVQVVNGLKYYGKDRPGPNDMRHEDIDLMVAYFENKCAYCGCSLEYGFVNEHFMTDGPTFPTNIIPACGSCNNSKGGKNPYTWILQTFGADQFDGIVIPIVRFFQRRSLETLGRH